MTPTDDTAQMERERRVYQAQEMLRRAIYAVRMYSPVTMTDDEVLGLMGVTRIEPEEGNR